MVAVSVAPSSSRTGAAPDRDAPRPRLLARARRRASPRTTPLRRRPARLRARWDHAGSRVQPRDQRQTEVPLEGAPPDGLLTCRGGTAVALSADLAGDSRRIRRLEGTGRARLNVGRAGPTTAKSQLLEGA